MKEIEAIESIIDDNLLYYILIFAIVWDIIWIYMI